MRVSVGERLHLGYRESDLLVWAGAWLCIGAQIKVRGDPDPQHTVPLELLSDWARASVWWLGAVIAIWVALKRPSNCPLGYGWLVVPCAMRALSNVAAFLLSFLPANVQTSFAFRGAWLEALTWLFITAVVMRQARRPDLPPNIRKRLRDLS